MHYTWDMIQDLATEPDEYGFRIAEIALAKGDSAVNLASTRHLIYGPLSLRFEMDRYGVNTIDFDPYECLALGPMNEWHYATPCGRPTLEGTTRCADHQIERGTK